MMEAPPASLDVVGNDGLEPFILLDPLGVRREASPLPVEAYESVILSRVRKG